MSAIPMIARCAEHQYPHLFGRKQIHVPHIPDSLRAGRETADDQAWIKAETSKPIPAEYFGAE